MKTRVFFRFIPPDSFASLNFNTQKEAEDKLEAFCTGGGEEHREYWAAMRPNCKIVKVTETIELI